MKLTIVKIGGNIIDNEKELNLVLNYFSKIKTNKILVHGGGKLATELNERLGIKTIMDGGRRVTSSENLDVVTMVYAGLINKNIIAKLQKESCDAIGLSGADGNIILAKKRPVDAVDFGFVGDIAKIDVEKINLLLTNNLTPVFCAISHDAKGQLLNTNADTIAAEIAIAMNKKYETELIYCFEKKGVLIDINDENSVIKTIHLEDYLNLKKRKKINEGMLPKMENCFYALKNNVKTVIIGDSNVIRDITQLKTELKL